MDRLRSSLPSISPRKYFSKSPPKPSDSPLDNPKTKQDCAKQLKDILVRYNVMDSVVDYLRELYKLNTNVFRCIHYRIIEKHVDDGYTCEGRLLEGLCLSDSKFQVEVTQPPVPEKKKSIDKSKTPIIECKSTVGLPELTELSSEVKQKQKEAKKERANLAMPAVKICVNSIELFDFSLEENKGSTAPEIDSEKSKDSEKQHEIKTEIKTNPNQTNMGYKIDFNKFIETAEFTEFCMEISGFLTTEPEQRNQTILEILKEVIELTFKEELEMKEKMLTTKITEWDMFWKGEVVTKDYDNCEQKLSALQSKFIEELCFLLHYQILMRLNYVERTKPIPIEKSKPFFLSLHSSSGSTSPKSPRPKELVGKK